MLDTIYGVDKEIITNAQQRFVLGDLLPPPDFIEERENQDKSGSQIEKL